MDLLLLHDFVTSCTGQLENISSLNYEVLPNVDKFHYVSNNHLLISENVLSVRKAAKLRMVDTIF